MQATDTPKLQPVHLYEGVAFLRIRGLPSPAAALTAYTAEGCTCRLGPGDIDPAHEPQWRQRLQNGGSVELDMSAPPFLPGVHLKAKVQHARIDPENRLELQLTFVDLESEERETLMSAVNSVFSAGTSDSSEGNSDRPQSAADRVAPTSGVYDSGVFRAVSKPGGKKGSNLLAAVNPDADSYRGRKLGEILVKTGQLTELQAEAATTQSKANNEKLGRYLLRTGLLTSTELCRALSYQSGLPMVDLSTTTTLPKELTSLFSYLHMLRYEYVPYDCTHDTVSVATLQPMPRNIVNEISSRCKKQVQLFLGEDDQIIRLLYTMQPQKDRKMRKAPRFSLKVPIALRLFDQDHSTLDDAVHYGKTIDLSEAGMMIATQYPAAINSSLHVSFTFAPHHIEALSTVRHVAAAAAADSEYKWQIGISFTELTQEARSSLAKACARLRVWNIADHRRE